MAGGIGSRFWPSSTKENPKQFLDILNTGKSLIRLTYERCLHIVPNENIVIATNKQYKDIVQEHLPELPNENILCEPTMNNTGPCVAYAALHIEAKNPQASFAVLPSDHLILKENEYIKTLNRAFEFAEKNDALLTLGIQPTRADTGYGYIEVSTASSHDNIYKVNSFKEKPDAKTAMQYFNTKKYYWNAGMFVWSVKSILNSFKTNAKSILEVLEEDKSNFGRAGEQDYVDKVYPNTDNISVDHAILEKAKNVFTIPADIGWSDLGTWASLYEQLEKDEEGNIVQANIAHLDNVKNSLIRAQNERIIVIKGLDNFIVVDEPGALLIYPKDLEQEIKDIVKKL